jgi:hypothetical protein
MGDLYTFFENIIIMIYNFYNSVFKTQKLPFNLIKVEVKAENKIVDVTKQYISNKNWNNGFSNDDIVYVTWSYINKTYKYVYRLKNPIEFPPYTIEQLRSKPKKKIIALNYVNENQSTIDLIKEYLGPMQNFYTDKCKEKMNLLWITDDQIDQLTIVDNTGQFSTVDSKNLELT